MSIWIRTPRSHSRDDTVPSKWEKISDTSDAKTFFFVDIKIKSSTYAKIMLNTPFLCLL